MKNKDIFCFIVTVICMISIFILSLGCADATNNGKVIEEEIVIDLGSTEKEFYLSPQTHAKIETTNREELKELIERYISYKENAHAMAQAARALGYSEEHPVIQLAKEEWYMAHKLQTEYQDILNRLAPSLWEESFEIYPIATEIWLYLRGLGYNCYVSAGIIGNMMAECGGQTLNLQPEVYSPGGSFYGICQWSNIYYPEIHGKNLAAQLDFLKSNIEREFDTFGLIYQNDFGYDEFLQIQNTEDAALAFAKVYERCGSSTYSIRQKNARAAYDYFIKFEEVA